MHVTSAAKIFTEDENSFWELFVNNNPAGIIALYKKSGAKNLPTHPIVDNVYPIIRNLLDSKNYKELGYLLANVPYNPNVNNFTTSAALWQAMGVPQGNFVQLYKTYFPQQYALTTLTV